MLQPTTLLEAINYMLSAVGEAPITNINEDLAESEIAQNTLTAVSREVQSQGWSWNTQRKRKLMPTSANEIELPQNTLRVDAVDSVSGRSDSSKRYVDRGGKLYDVLNRTKTFTEGVYVNLVEGLGFDDLPETARRFILLDATSRYMQFILGTDADLQQVQMQSQRAWLTLEQEEDDLLDLNILSQQPLINFASGRTRILD